MRSFRSICRISAVLALYMTAPAFAGVSATVSIGGGATTSFLSPAIGTAGPTKTITLTFSDNGHVGFGAQLTSLAAAGANAADFAIVGGTCAQGTPVLNSGSPTCTVVVQYAASSAGAENAQLTGKCSTIGLIGGFSLVCDGNNGPLASLLGSLVNVLASTPLLDPKMLTVLFALLLGIGVYFANRKHA